MNGPVPYEMEVARWWDKGWVQDFPPCVTGCLHVLPLWVILTMEEKERKCGGFLISCCQDGDFEEAKSPPNGGFEKGKKPCQIVQMHQSPSKMVMESATLSVIHQRECHREKKGASEG